MYIRDFEEFMDAAEIEERVTLLQRLVDTDCFDVVAFERILAELSYLNSRSVIQPLLTVFRDEFQFEEVLYSVVHTIESFSDEIYIEEILKGFVKAKHTSPRWLGILLMRILNDENSREILVRKTRQSMDVELRRALDFALAEVSNSNPDLVICVQRKISN